MLFVSKFANLIVIVFSVEERCEHPAISNGRVRPQKKKYEKNENIQIICNEGHSAQVDELVCHSGGWDLGGYTLQNLCKQKSSFGPVS